MARPQIDPGILADRGVPLRLQGGLEVRLCYTFTALMAMEERFGSIAAAVKVLEEAEKGATFGALADLLACGLRHEVEPHNPDRGQNGHSLGNRDVLVEYLDPQDLGVYAEAMGEAFVRAFPAQDDDDADPTTGAATDASPGAPGTTSPASSSASPKTSSGA